MKVSYRDKVLTVYLRDKLNGDDFQECFTIDQNIDLSYEKFFFVSALSGMAINNHHYVYGIRTYDLDQKIDKAVYERTKKLKEQSAQQKAE